MLIPAPSPQALFFRYLIPAPSPQALFFSLFNPCPVAAGAFFFSLVCNGVRKMRIALKHWKASRRASNSACASSSDFQKKFKNCPAKKCFSAKFPFFRKNTKFESIDVGGNTVFLEFSNHEKRAEKYVSRNLVITRIATEKKTQFLFCLLHRI